MVLATVAALGGVAAPAAAASPSAASDAGVVRVASAQVADAAAHPLQLKVLSRGTDAVPLLTSSTPGGYAPAQVRSYLGLTGTGAGQTIAVVTAYDAPNIVKTSPSSTRPSACRRRRRSAR
jgi:hypothetical protein